MKTIVDRIEVVHELDHDPDLSWLADPANYAGESEADQAKYMAQDQERLDAYNRGDWACVGVVAKAHLRIALDDHPEGTYVLQTVMSPGIWGVEDDSGADYLDELGREQVEEVKDILRAMSNIEGIEQEITVCDPTLQGS